MLKWDRQWWSGGSRRKRYLNHFDAMEIETFRDGSKFVQEHNGFIFVVCRLKVTYFFGVRSRGVDVVLPSLMVVDGAHF